MQLGVDRQATATELQELCERLEGGIAKKDTAMLTELLAYKPYDPLYDQKRPQDLSLVRADTMRQVLETSAIDGQIHLGDGDFETAATTLAKLLYIADIRAGRLGGGGHHDSAFEDLTEGEKGPKLEEAARIIAMLVR